MTAPFSDVIAFEQIHRHTVEVDRSEIPLDFAVHHLPPGIEALAMYDDQRHQIVLALSPDTYQYLEVHEPRARFTFAHELGHACLHATELVRLGRIPHQAAALLRGKTPQHPAYRDTEWQANSFAAAILMPAQGLVALEERCGQLTPDLVRREFRVSSAAAQIRIAKFAQYRKDLLV